jgi:hypothetical protein
LLNGPPFPLTMAEAWYMFEEIGLARSGTGFGPAPLSHAEILSWSRLTGLRVRPWHAQALRVLDVTFLGITSVEDKDLDFASLATAVPE